jgi:hypothetical protein
MKITDLSKTQQQRLREAGRGRIILARLRGEKGGWKIKFISAYDAKYRISEIDALLEKGYHIVERLGVPHEEERP